MKIIESIKIPSSKGVWFKTLDDLKAQWRSVGFMVVDCLRTNCNISILVFHGDLVYGIPVGYHEEKLQ